jgi:phosphatidylglycerol---prolipoprotein diacylglyceryl transferase
MSATGVHTGFDALAWIAAALSYYLLARHAGVKFPPSPATDWHYFAMLVFGAGIGAVSFGTANLWLSQQAGFARSIEGAIAGGILAVELYKRGVHIMVRTGARFALPLAVGVAVGRIGCYLAGLDDFTHGTPTTLISGTASCATRCSSTKASPWRVSQWPMLHAC